MLLCRGYGGAFAELLNADVPTCIAMLARVVGSNDPGLQQLYLSLVRCQTDLKAAAAALLMHADRNVRMARALPVGQVWWSESCCMQPACMCRDTKDVQGCLCLVPFAEARPCLPGLVR